MKPVIARAVFSKVSTSWKKAIGGAVWQPAPLGDDDEQTEKEQWRLHPPPADTTSSPSADMRSHGEESLGSWVAALI